MRKITALILSLSFALTMVACGDNSDSSNQNTEWSVITQPTCTEQGLKERYVSGVLIQEPIEALGHSYGAWSTTTEPTCIVNGKEERQCTRCSYKEENVLTAHHTLKQGFKFDENAHYYECENCTDKIDLTNHDFEITTEDKYIYLMNDNILYDLTMAKVGYVSTLTCSACDVCIVDYSLVKKYSYPVQLYHSKYFMDIVGIKSCDYDIEYALYMPYTPNVLEINYDSNYNVSGISYVYDKLSPNTFLDYDYIYNEDNLLTKIELTQNLMAGFECYYEFTYDNNTLTQIATIVQNTFNGNFFEVYYDFGDDGNIVKQSNYSKNALGSFKITEFIFDKGYLVKRTDYTYQGEVVSGETVQEYTNTFDSNGNIIERMTDGVSTIFTYNSNNQLTNITRNGQELFRLTYDNNKLQNFSYIGYYTYTYEYTDNKVMANDNNSNLVLSIEYLNDRIIVD